MIALLVLRAHPAPPFLKGTRKLLRWFPAPLFTALFLTACGPQVDEDGNLVERPPESTPADRLYYCAGLLTGIEERGETARWLGGETETAPLIERLETAAQDALRQAGLIEWDGDVRTGRYRTARADLAIQMPAVDPETCVREAELLGTAGGN